jgi:hypothetical protein
MLLHKEIMNTDFHKFHRFYKIKRLYYKLSSLKLAKIPILFLEAAR